MRETGVSPADGERHPSRAYKGSPGETRPTCPDIDEQGVSAVHEPVQVLSANLSTDLSVPSTVSFTAWLKPKGKERPRHDRPGSVRTPDATVRHELALRMAGLAAVQGHRRPLWPWQALALEVLAVLPRPQARPEKVPTWLWHHGEVPAPVKPDASNVLKAVEDAMNPTASDPLGVLWGDDAQVVDARIRTVYAAQGASPRIDVYVRLVEAPFPQEQRL